ncbi:MAG: hypothetical protein Q9184_001975 [Pyrenodesmia sp. 2 TL-2023]
MAPYPSAATIEGIFHYRTLPRHADKFEQYVCDTAEVHSPGIWQPIKPILYTANSASATKVFGQDFKLGGRNRGRKAFREFNKQMHSMADLEGGDKIEILNVIGGREQAWAAVNTRCVPANNDAKGFYSEMVYLVKFDLDGKITHAKIFMDTKQAHAHVGE